MVRSRSLAWGALASAGALALALTAAPAAQSPQPRHYDELRRMAAASPFKNLTWQFVGPTNVSGRVTDIAVAKRPGRTRAIYVATASGGVWLSENDGTSWAPIFDDAPSTAIGAVAVAPSSPDIVWVGTGEANIFRTLAGRRRPLQVGRRRQDLALMGLAATERVARILVHPANPDVVYVAAPGHEWTPNAERGVYKTTDGGNTWQKVLYVDTMTGAIDLVMDPSDPNVLYAATWDTCASGGTTRGTSPGYNGQRHLQDDRRRPDLDADERRAARAGVPGPHRPVDRALEPERDLRQPGQLRIARTAKPGELDAYGRHARTSSRARRCSAPTTRAHVAAGQRPGAFMERVSGTYGWVFGQIRADPTDENRVYIMGLGLNVSTDGGKTFRRSRACPAATTWALDRPGEPGRYSTARPGLGRSYDGGQTWRASPTSSPSRSSSTSPTTWTRRSTSTGRCRTTAAPGASSICARGATRSRRRTSRRRLAERGRPGHRPVRPGHRVPRAGSTGTLAVRSFKRDAPAVKARRPHAGPHPANRRSGANGSPR